MRMAPRSIALALLAGLALLAAPAQAHDYWLEPRPATPALGSELDLTLWVGEALVPEEERPMQRPRTVAAQHYSAAGVEDLLASPTPDGQRPFARVRLSSAGGHLFAVERNTAHIELPARKFNRYLRHEGLRPVLKQRIAAGERRSPARERYTRYLKSYAQVGATADGTSQRVVGHALELVPERDLGDLRPGDAITFVVRFRGAPLAGASLAAHVRGADGRVRSRSARADSRGRVTFRLDRPGLWVVRLVHMQRCAGCDDADWESFWSAYSFGLAARGG